MNYQVLIMIGMIFVLFVSGCVSENGNVISNEEDTMTVKNGDTVKVAYVGKLEDGTVFDSTEKHGGDPLEFVVGAGQMISGFDKAVVGMKKGEEKEVTLDPADAYGDHNPELVIKIPKANAPEGAKVGDVLGMRMGNGQTAPARVILVDDANVTLDMNHELAGKSLIFSITIVDFSS